MPDDTSWPKNISWHDYDGENDLIDSYFTELKHEDEKYEKEKMTKNSNFWSKIGVEYFSTLAISTFKFCHHPQPPKAN